MKLSGLFFIALTIYSKFSRRKNSPLPSRHYLFAGAFIGFLTGAVSVSGPPLALFLNRAKVSNRKFREIFAAFSVVTAVIAIAGYYQTGMISTETLKISLLFTPILLTGTIVGKKLNTKMSVSSFQRTNIVLTLIASLLLIVNPG
ncbi:sulfite exporter TauE/SafE family protein [Marinilabilia salmonicolor]|uniref:sulfite exporter TauE/SafE family protein n=1 Tax=Marinilabilia salmonicolor TaxID=989 RepID=UPI00131F4339|nr:sulfite exporter TauE/SafE family protein [Marinilabilia salmonicolor]